MGNIYSDLRKVLLIFSLLPALFLSCDRNSNFLESPLAPVAKLVIPAFFTTQTGEVELRSFFENVDRVRPHIIEYGFLVSDQPFEEFAGAKKISLGNTLDSEGWFAANTTGLTQNFHYCRSFVSYDDNESYFSEMSVINTRPGRWVEKSSFPGDAKISATSFVIKNTAYIAGGHSDELWSFNPETDTWTQMASCPEPLENPVCFVVGNNAYIGTNVMGIHSDRLADFWKYDPAINEWSVVASPSLFKGTFVTNPFAFSMGNYGYIECNYNHLIQYDPVNNKWQDANPNTVFEFDREDATVVAGDDKVMVIGGHNILGDYLDDVQIFSGQTGGWEIKNDFPNDLTLTEKKGRTGGLGFFINGKFYAGMGEAENRQSNSDLYVYDPEMDQWVANTPIPAPDLGNLGIQQGVGFAVNGKGYIGLGRRNYGFDAGSFSEFNFRIWEFTPE